MCISRFKASHKMPPVPPSGASLPRLITYYQTHHTPEGTSISILPLLTRPRISMTHVILAAIHLNDDPKHITLNDHVPAHPRFETLWAELRILQAAGIKVMALLGGAAKGSYERLDGDEETFERYYVPLRDMFRERGLDGIDLDVEEEMSLRGVIRLIDRLRADFGRGFIISLAPVAAAMLSPKHNLSGFDYEALEVMRGSEISWYNLQFYCGWGDFTNPLMYDMIIRKGWAPGKIVVGLVTNPANGPGFVAWYILEEVLRIVQARYPNFGGVMGWEYFNSLPGEHAEPWQWGAKLTSILRSHFLLPEASSVPIAARLEANSQEQTPQDDAEPGEAQIPKAFDYYSDNN